MLQLPTDWAITSAATGCVDSALMTIEWADAMDASNPAFGATQVWPELKGSGLEFIPNRFRSPTTARSPVFTSR